MIWERDRSLIHLHLFVHPGGGTAFSKSVWTVKEYVGGGDSPYVTLYYHSFDGEQGTPKLTKRL
jgi:hypothetical protein